MKVVFTIAKKFFENNQLKAVGAEEIVAENVASFNFDEAVQRARIFYNDGKDETLELFKNDGDKMYQWFLLDIKVMQIPLKVKL